MKSCNECPKKSGCRDFFKKGANAANACHCHDEEEYLDEEEEDLDEEEDFDDEEEDLDEEEDFDDEEEEFDDEGDNGNDDSSDTYEVDVVIKRITTEYATVRVTVNATDEEDAIRMAKDEIDPEIVGGEEFDVDSVNSCYDSVTVVD